MSGTSDSIPTELLSSGKSLDPCFLATELLFLRFRNMEQGKVATQDIKYVDQSVNRGKYSKSNWVLLGAKAGIAWGVAQFNVGDVPSRLSGPPPDAVEFQYAVEHDPEPENYSHSEIRPYKHGARVRKTSQVSEQVKLQFRLELSEASKVLVPPSAK